MACNYNTIVNIFLQRLIKVLKKYTFIDYNNKETSALLRLLWYNNKTDEDWKKYSYKINNRYLDALSHSSINLSPNDTDHIINYESLVFEKEQKICNILQLLSCFENKEESLTIEEFVLLLEMMIEALNCLNATIKKNGVNKNDIKALKDDLEAALKNKIKIQAKLTHEPNTNSHPERIESTLLSESFRRVLSIIKEDDKNDEKMDLYINVIYPRLLMEYILTWIEKGNLSDQSKNFQDWFLSIITDILFGKKPDHIAQTDYIRFMGLYTCKLPEEENIKKKAFQFLLSRDFDFWLEITNSIIRHDKYKNIFVFDGNITNDYIISLGREFKQYRNRLSHSGDLEFSQSTVVKVLAMLTDFAQKANLMVESSLLGKRLYFERAKLYGVRGSSSYDDIDYRWVTFEKEPSTRWKDVAKIKDTLIEPSYNEVSKLKNYEKNRLIVNSIFEFNSTRDTVVNNIIKQFQKYFVLFPYQVAGQAFCEYLKICYPFHPAFFLLTQKMELKDVYKLALNAAQKDESDLDCSNALIMPWEIDIDYPAIKKVLIEEFSLGFRIEYGSSEKEPTSHGWNFVKNQFLFGDNSILNICCKRWNGDITLCLNLSKIVLFLNTLRLYLDTNGLSGDNLLKKQSNCRILPNRDWIRFCMWQPGCNINKLEDSISILLIAFPYLKCQKKNFPTESEERQFNLTETFYEFVYPSKEKEKVSGMMDLINKNIELKETVGKETSEKIAKIERQKADTYKQIWMDYCGGDPDEEVKGWIRKSYEDCETNIQLEVEENNYFPDFLSYIELLDYFKNKTIVRSISRDY